MSIIKRVYFYTVSIITLGIFAVGVQILLRLIFDLLTGTSQVQVEAAGFKQQQLSLGLAMLVIGGTLWTLFWRAIQKQVSGNPTEIGSAIRKLFLNIILVVSALVALTATAEVLNWLMRGVPREPVIPGRLATAIVAGSIWYYHWRVAEKEGAPSPAAQTLRRWYVYILSAWGLITLAIWLVQLISRAILSLPIWGEAISSNFWSTALSRSLSWILVAGAAWYFHWFRMAKSDTDSTLRQVYLYLMAIPGGTIAGLVALTTAVYKIIRFILGSLDVAPNVHFQFLGWTIPTMLVAAAIWGYHKQAAQEEAARLTERKLSARRIHFYLMSFIGLGTLIAGLIILIGIFIELPTSAVGPATVTSTPGWWRQQLSLSLALLLVASPIWMYYWNNVLRLVAENGNNERIARSRRIFLYVLVGAAIITLAADLVNIVYQLLNGLLLGKFGVEVLRRSKWSLQTLFVAAPVLWYHWRVLRQDQRLGAEQLLPHKTVTILAGEPAQELVALIEKKLGSPVRRLHYSGQPAEAVPTLSDEQAEKLVNDIRAAPVDKVMVVIAGSQAMVLPYKEK
ncbi:MAG: hypothetical protein HY529_05095 [Chloroflexi bacterium]|nr:hypothetical protein [Chloroflexota bacterium]